MKRDELSAHEEGRSGAKFGDSPQNGPSREAQDHYTVRRPPLVWPGTNSPAPVPIRRYDVVVTSRRDGTRQVWAECVELHRANAYAEDLRRLCETAQPDRADELEIDVVLTAAILERPDGPGLRFSDEILLDEPLDEEEA